MQNVVHTFLMFYLSARAQKIIPCSFSQKNGSTWSPNLVTGISFTEGDVVSDTLQCQELPVDYLPGHLRTSPQMHYFFFSLGCYVAFLAPQVTC